MNERFINKQIRRICLYKLILPACLLAITICAIVFYPFKQKLQPLHLDSPTDYTSSSKDIAFSADFNKLYYTGEAAYRNKHVTGYFYYCFKETDCFFVLVESTDSTPKMVLENYTASGKMIRKDDALKQVISKLAGDLDWFNEDLDDMTFAYYLDETAYHPLPYQILLGVLYLFTALFSFVLLYWLYCLMVPGSHPALLRLSRFGKRHTVLEDFLKDCNEHLDLCRHGLYVTDRYLMAFSYSNLVILPLSELEWLYRMGQGKHPDRHKRPRYVLYFYDKHMRKYKIEGMRADATSDLINYCKDPDFIYHVRLQYNEENIQYYKNKV